MSVIKKLAKKLRRAEEQEDDVQELLVIEDEPEDGVQSSEFQDTVMERLSAIDDELPRLKMGVNSIRKEVSEIRNELGRLDENLRDIMMLYEVVSTQINPFIGESKVTATSMEKLERMNDLVKTMKEDLDDVFVDLRIMNAQDLDVNSIISDVFNK